MDCVFLLLSSLAKTFFSRERESIYQINETFETEKKKIQLQNEARKQTTIITGHSEYFENTRKVHEMLNPNPGEDVVMVT